jgi:hypothetical protein
VTTAVESLVIDSETTTEWSPLLSRWHMTAAVQVPDVIVIVLSLLLALVLFRDDANSIAKTRWIDEAPIIGGALCLGFHISGSYRYTSLIDPLLLETVLDNGVEGQAGIFWRGASRSFASSLSYACSPC